MSKLDFKGTRSTQTAVESQHFKTLYNLALTQHKRPFWDDGTMCIRMLIQEPPGSRDSSPTPPSLGRAGGKTKTTGCTTCHFPQPNSKHKHDRTAGQLRTHNYTEDIRAEIERVAVTCSVCATSTISHSLNTSALFGTMGRCASECLYKSHQAPGTAVPLHPPYRAGGWEN